MTNYFNYGVNDFIKYNRATSENAQLTAQQKMTILARYIFNNYNAIKVNNKLIDIKQLKIGDYILNTRPKTSTTYCIDYDAFNKLSIYRRVWHRKQQCYIYQKMEHIYLLRGLKND